MRIKKISIMSVLFTLFVFINSGRSFCSNSADLERLKKISLETSNVYQKYASIIDGATIPLRMKEIKDIVEFLITPEVRELYGWTPIADSLLNFTKITLVTSWAFQQLPKAELNAEISIIIGNEFLPAKTGKYDDISQKMSRKYNSWPSNRFLFWALKNLEGLSATEWDALIRKDIKHVKDLIEEQKRAVGDLKFILERARDIKLKFPEESVKKEFKEIANDMLDFLDAHRQILEQSEKIISEEKTAPTGEDVTSAFQFSAGTNNKEISLSQSLDRGGYPSVIIEYDCNKEAAIEIWRRSSSLTFKIEFPSSGDPSFAMIEQELKGRLQQEIGRIKEAFESTYGPLKLIHSETIAPGKKYQYGVQTGRIPENAIETWKKMNEICQRFGISRPEFELEWTFYFTVKAKSDDIAGEEELSVHYKW
jgi:hypothetical protein